MPRILIIDDNPQVAKSLARSLKLRGFESQIELNHERILELAQAGWPDLILLDRELVGYPVQGGQIAELLKSNPQTAAIPIIGISGFNEFSNLEQTNEIQPLRQTVNAFVGKPIDIIYLIEKINELLVNP